MTRRWLKAYPLSVCDHIDKASVAANIWDGRGHRGSESGILLCVSPSQVYPPSCNMDSPARQRRQRVLAPYMQANA